MVLSVPQQGLPMSVAWRLIDALKHCISSNEYVGLYFFTPYASLKGKEKLDEISEMKTPGIAPFTLLFGVLAKYSWSRLFIMSVLSVIQDLLEWFKAETKDEECKK